MKGKLLIRNLLLVIACALCASAVATETENMGMQVLPAPGKVAIDGKFGDWDLTGGILACSDAENLRDQYSQWFHTMYDAKNLYVLARWKDPTPLNNRGVKGDHGFAGDCLQFRTVTTDAEENHHSAEQRRTGATVLPGMLALTGRDDRHRDCRRSLSSPVLVNRLGLPEQSRKR